MDNSYLHKQLNFDWNKKNISGQFVATNDPIMWFFQHLLVVIHKRKCLVGGSRIRCRESGTPSTIIYTWWRAIGMKDLNVMLLWPQSETFQKNITISLFWNDYAQLIFQALVL